MYVIPVLAAVLTVATTLVSLQLTTAVSAPPITTELLPCVAPKFEPVKVTFVPGRPLELLMLSMCGRITENGKELEAVPLAHKNVVPEVLAAELTTAVTLVSLQLTTDASAPPITTELPLA
jgi:hypothetical protein